VNLYTIGHSVHPIDKFIDLLKAHGVTRLVDVRSKPYSRFNPQFNKKALQHSLLDNGIEYTYLGDSLGGRPGDPSCYIHGTLPAKSSDYIQLVDYQAVMRRQWFVEGITTLLALAGQQTTCILCSEKDPLRCHRHHLIAVYLLEHNPDFTIWHILADSSLINAGSIATREAKSN